MSYFTVVLDVRNENKTYVLTKIPYETTVEELKNLLNRTAVPIEELREKLFFNYWVCCIVFLSVEKRHFSLSFLQVEFN